MSRTIQRTENKLPTTVIATPTDEAREEMHLKSIKANEHTRNTTTMKYKIGKLI